MPKVVVIGSNSFSGQDFVDLLLDDPAFSVIGVSRSPEKDAAFLSYRSRPDLSRYQYQQFDMNRDIDSFLAMLDAEKPEYIVNFAAQSEVAPSWEHPEHWFQTNTVALAKMVNHLRHRDYLKRYLHVSSPEAYGTCVGVVTETTPDNPSTPYAASKAAADMLLSVYQKQYGFPLLTVRSTNVYGARQQLFKIIPRTVIYIRLGKKIQLHGGGVAVKSYIHIRDVSKGELAILTKGRIGERYHISPDQGVAVRDVVRILAERMGKSFAEATETVAERPGQDAAYVIDSTKARTELCWKQEISLAEGLGGVIDWVEDNWDVLQNIKLDYIHTA
jgi:dTDP-glucose 4,6-dehydratase